MPDQFRVVNDQARGRHLVAHAEIPVGSLLLSDPPVEAVLYDEQLPLRCSWTFSEETSLLRCSRCCSFRFGLPSWKLSKAQDNYLLITQDSYRCRVARYSTREAQLAAWKSGHREECSALRDCSPRLPPATVRLAARVQWRSIRYASSCV